MRRPVWRKLRSLFRDYLAAVLPGTRTALSGEHDGSNRWPRILVLFGRRRDVRLDLRPLDRRRWNAHVGSQNVCWDGSGKRRAAPPWLRARWPNDFGDPAVAGVRSGRDVRVQYLGDHANACGAANGGPLDWFPEF